MIEINEKQLKLENNVWQLNNLVGPLGSGKGRSKRIF